MTREQYLEHHGILGQKWGHKAGPPYPLDASDHTVAEKKAGYTDSLEKNGKGKYSTEERIRNGKELNNVIARSKANSETGRPSAKEVWTTSETMRKFAKDTAKLYKERNDIYDKKVDVPKDIKKLSGMFLDDELRYYVYGEKFAKAMRKKASEIVYNEEDVKTIMKLVEKADWDKINIDTYHDKAWLYWH